MDAAGIVVDFNGEAAAEAYYGVVPESLSFRGFRANIPDLPHPLGVKHLTHVSITISGDALSPIARSLNQNGLATIEPGTEPLLTLTFDGGAQGKTVDVRPALPLALKC